VAVAGQGKEEGQQDAQGQAYLRAEEGHRERYDIERRAQGILRADRPLC